MHYNEGICVSSLFVFSGFLWREIKRKEHPIRLRGAILCVWRAPVPGPIVSVPHTLLTFGQLCLAACEGGGGMLRRRREGFTRFVSRCVFFCLPVLSGCFCLSCLHSGDVVFYLIRMPIVAGKIQLNECADRHRFGGESLLVPLPLRFICLCCRAICLQMLHLGSTAVFWGGTE